MAIRRYQPGRGGRPSGPYVINRESPQALGLVFWASTIHGSLCELAVGQGFGKANTGPLARMAPHLGGCSWIKSASSSFYSWATLDDAFVTGPITLCWWGIVDTGSAFRHFMGKHASNGSANNPFDFRTDNSGTPTLALVRAAANSSSWAGPAITLGAEALYGVTQDGNGTHNATFFKNGVTTAASPAGGGADATTTGSGANLQIGRRADGAVQLDGAIADVRIYNRELSADEIWRLYDPATRWDLYWVPSGRRYVFIGPAAGFKSAWAAGANQILGGSPSC